MKANICNVNFNHYIIKFKIKLLNKNDRWNKKQKVRKHSDYMSSKVLCKI